MLRLILLAVSILLSNYAFAQEEIILKLTQQCDDGSVSSCAQLGDLYLQRSIQEHIALCDQGELEYCKMLGRLYVYGSGVDQDYGVAFKYFLKGCVLRKDTNSFCNSNNKVNPSDISVDLKRVADHWKTLCDADDSSACIRLGLSYQYGYGIQSNSEIAFNYFLGYCGDSKEVSCTQLGHAYRNVTNILGVPLKFGYRKDVYLFYEKACQQNDSKGCYELAVMHPDKKQFKNLALYEKSCRLGYGYACLVLGGAYLGNHHSDLNVKVDVSKSKRYFKQACGTKTGANCLGNLFGLKVWGTNAYKSDYLELMRRLCYEEGINGFCEYVSSQWDVESELYDMR